jgi:hypothetical protein
MTAESQFEQRLRLLLHDALDGETGAYPLWQDAPAVTWQDSFRRVPGRPFRLLALAAVLALGGALGAGAVVLLSPKTPDNEVVVVPTSSPSPSPSPTPPWDVRVGACTLTLIQFLPARTTMTPPYIVNLGAGIYPIRGPMPSPLPIKAPVAHVDFMGEGWGGAAEAPGRPVGTLTGPSGGFMTLTGVGGFQGTMLFDSVGTWHATIDNPARGCRVDLTIQVEAAVP